MLNCTCAHSRSMLVAEFLRTYHIRAPNLMWFLGAGASAAANIPTAGDVIWDFKRKLYCSRERHALATCADLSDPVLRTRLQRYFDDIGTFPVAWSADEYAEYFEAMYRDPSDRRRYIDQLVAKGTPSHGHLALAALFAIDRARVVWTTNFDRVVEDAAARVLGGSGRLVTATLDNAAVAREALNEGRWPLLVKLHGDFQSTKLKNVRAELAEQDAELRRALVEACGRFGLVVAGYSGRDDSVMRALEDAVQPGAFPSGLFWLHPSLDTPAPRVAILVERARAANIDARLVPIETFDELLGDLLDQLPAIPSEVRTHVQRAPERLGEAPIPAHGDGYPVIRLNALVVTPPSTCRLVRCAIGGSAEVRSAVEDSGAEVVAVRRRQGVLAFGSDADVQRAFGKYAIEGLDLHPIDGKVLSYDSQEHSLVVAALARALTRERPVRAVRRRSRYNLIVDERGARPELLQPLRSAVGTVSGIVPGTGIPWAEAARIRLELRLGRFWLLLVPYIWMQPTDDPDAEHKCRAFRHNRTIHRYNPKANNLLDAWAGLVTGDTDQAELRAFGAGDGVDAVFTVGRRTGYSRRTGGRKPARASRGAERRSRSGTLPPAARVQ